MILLPIFVSVTNKTKFMPEICRFFGIIIFLYWKDHNPPHIHFTYGDYECSISVLDRIVDGRAPAKVIAKVNEWINLHVKREEKHGKNNEYGRGRKEKSPCEIYKIHWDAEADRLTGPDYPVPGIRVHQSGIPVLCNAGQHF